MTKTCKVIFFFVKKSLRLGKNRLREKETIISFGGFAISVAILTASLTLLSGYQKTLKEGLLGVNAHIYFYNLVDRRLTTGETGEISKFLANQTEVESFSPVVMTQVMAVGEDQVKGVIARSIDWQRDDLPINYHRYINRGSGDLTNRNDAVLGSQLAEYLQVGVGDQVSLLSPANMQYTIFGLQTGEIIVRVSGIHHSGIYDTDSRTVFLNEEIISSLTTLNGQYDIIEVKLHDEHIDRADYLSYLWNQMLEHRFLIHSWIDFNSNLFTMLVLQQWVIGIILSFLVLIASFNIINNTTTTILERKKEIGILKATGCNNIILKLFFLSKTSILSLFAVIMGLGSGLLLAYLLAQQAYLMLRGDVYFIEEFRISIEIATILVILVISMFIAVMATIIALRKISKLTVIESIRNS